MIANTLLIEKLLFDSEISTNQIAKDNEIGVMTISDLRNKKTDYMRMRLDNAIKLTKYAIEKGLAE